ncbi:hypothetical protein SEA_PATIO_57 [Gordonia phage Patio]|uniref:Uncharacterized protein n=3 Tax=Skysandvirus TaxID=2948912 RepID=A0A2D2W507_9CAUD|nr:hypothetical protein KNT76_gp57 [Gordonia phage Patio]YP_010098124.1 hypothetical protein KNU08_gp56 [Gordonia phage Skysand]YP_010103166.1 hypothetical protein KNU64_gp59 [Gordonia Phage Lollipop1437]QRI45296.1 hypothetical protein SEA_ENNEA_60 [Gordonia phage Ennea]QXN74439.1 hypothetical protein SEA_FLOAT294_56 [Gordonia phage Float294]ATS93139.1 hypothetical protein SEA_PATIO_57 [Gordonia phage Patio]AXQ62090.1 hypothetical protein SEA_SKYSAND_56 [Gordonia phage Skysand]QDF19163.1 hyp
MDIDKVLSELDFQPRGLTCDGKRMLWTTRRTQSTLPDNLRLAEVDPEGCQNRTTVMYAARLCPCWNDPRNFARVGKRFEDYVFADGLLVSQFMLCDAHLSYFRDYLHYPFLCPGCGVHFENADEIILGQKSIEEMM